MVKMSSIPSQLLGEGGYSKDVTGRSAQHCRRRGRQASYLFPYSLGKYHKEGNIPYINTKNSNFWIIIIIIVFFFILSALSRLLK
jgi:amino acid transporter